MIDEPEQPGVPAPEVTTVEIRKQWVGADTTPTLAVNDVHFGVGASPQEVVLTFGHAPPPPLLGSPDEQLAQAKALPYLPVHTLFRASFTADAFAEFRQNLANFAAPHGNK